MILSEPLLQMKVRIDADGADGRRYRKRHEKKLEDLDQKDMKKQHAAYKIQR